MFQSLFSQIFLALRQNPKVFTHINTELAKQHIRSTYPFPNTFYCKWHGFSHEPGGFLGLAAFHKS